MATPRLFTIRPVMVRPRVRLPPRRRRIHTTFAALCRRAGIVLRATIPDRLIIVYRGRRQVHTLRYDLVGVPVNPRSRMGALRALEALAYSHFHHAARMCVCGRGVFRAPVGAEIQHMI